MFDDLSKTATDSLIARIKELESELAAYKEAYEDKRRLCREIDQDMYGDGAARQPSLCDIASSVRDLVKKYKAAQKDAERWRWWRTRVNWTDGAKGFSTARTAPITIIQIRDWIHSDVRHPSKRPDVETVDEYVDVAMEMEKR